uniref:Uncharacterized protein n=1 Tax=Manihot esculenta TaxID=3983 RepID=A0A2C9VNK1_MANES
MRKKLDALLGRTFKVFKFITLANLATSRVAVFKNQRQIRVCPDEMKEAVSSLIYASNRCGDFPELLEIRTIFTAWYGKEFAARAIELRNNCGVNPRMIQKLSTRQPSLYSRLKVLKEIASENNIILQLEEASLTNEEALKQNHYEPESSTSSGGPKRKYKDAVDAAQDAFKLSANAAAAAKAALELSRSEPHDTHNNNSSKNRGKSSMR